MPEIATGLDDPDYAAFAWARYRLIMRWMTGAMIIIVTGAILLLNYAYGPLSWITIAAAVGGFGGTIMLTAALMGLVFLSSGTGHDEQVHHID